MPSFKLNTYLLRSFAFLALFLPVMLSCRPLAAAIAPAHDVIIIDNQEKLDNPSWKNIWDEARRLSRNGKLADASNKYRILLSIKPNIEEAKWEYCKVLVELERWSDASIILESLLEIDPNRTDYLLKAGTVALHKRQYQQAVKYFGQVYQKGPYDTKAIEALEGMAAALQDLGRKREIFPLLQQLYLRQPNNKKVLLQLARLTKELGWLKKAGFYYSTLVSNFKIEDQVLLEAAFVYEKQGEEGKALVYQLKYLEIHPTYLPFQKNVADYYLKHGKKQLALPHLLVLNERGEGGDALLLQIADIYLHEEDRPDKALFYLEEYQKKHPDDSVIAREIAQTQSTLAKDLLSIVLNDGAEMLWNDLAKITPNRQAIFESMADLLELQGKEKELFQVLEIIHTHNPKDKKVIWRLANLSFRSKKYKVAYNYLRLLNGSEREFPRYLLLRADVEKLLGYQYAELLTSRKILGDTPDNISIRKNALQLAGDLGLVKELHALYLGTPKKIKQTHAGEEFEIIYTKALIKNRMFSDAEEVLNRNHFLKNDKQLLSLKLQLVQGFYKEGRVFLAEQMVREILGENSDVEQALGQLSQMAFEGGDLDWGKAWLSLLAQKTGVDLSANDYVHWPKEVFELKVEQIVAEKQYETAIAMLRDYISQVDKESTKDKQELTLKAEISICRLLFKDAQYEEAKNLIHRLLDKFPDEVELLAVLEKIQHIQSLETSEVKVQPVEDVSNLKPLLKLKAAEYAYEYGSFKKADSLVRSYLKIVPSSVNAQILKGEILVSQQRFDRALKIFNRLSKEYPLEEFFHRKVWELEFKQGNFKKLVDEIPTLNNKKTAGLVSNDLKIAALNDLYWRKLLLARSYWAEGQLDDSIKVYESMLNTPVQKVFLQKINSVKADFHFPQAKRSFWDKVTFTYPQNNDSLATVMDPWFVGNHLGLPINRIAAGLYEEYRWQKLIRNELSAKQAVKRRDYHQAEKEYKALIKKEDSDETIFDLAKVYSRLELYGKEGELYEQLKKKGSEYPELDVLAQQNALKRLPRVSLDYLFLNENGRDGYIDTRKRSVGIEGWQMPAFNQELDVRLERNSFISNDSTQKIWTNKLIASYTINLDNDTDLLINFGGNFAKSQDNFLYKLEVNRRMNESLSGNITFKQSEVDDTIQALREGICYREIDAGLKIDSLSRLFFGGDFSYRRYTDDNQQNRFHLWTSYDLFGEVSRLQLLYEFTSFQSRLTNLGHYSNAIDDQIPGDIPYWSPNRHWEHLGTVRFKHNIENETKNSTNPSYYTLYYSVGYESEREMINSLGFNIFVEMSKHFLLKGNLKYYNSGGLSINTGLFSIIYRW